MNRNQLASIKKIASSRSKELGERIDKLDEELRLLKRECNLCDRIRTIINALAYEEVNLSLPYQRYFWHFVTRYEKTETAFTCDFVLVPEWCGEPDGVKKMLLSHGRLKAASPQDLKRETCTVPDCGSEALIVGSCSIHSDDAEKNHHELFQLCVTGLHLNPIARMG